MPRNDSGEKRRRQWAPDARALTIVGDRWLMVIVRDLAAGPLRLEELRRRLPGVSAGALESRLAKMAEEGLLERRRHRSLPPRVDLELTARGRSLLPLVGALAQWQLRTRCSRPRDDEWIDVGAWFRLAPLLPAPATTGRDAEIGLTVHDEERTEHYAFIQRNGDATVEQRPAPDAAATMTGTLEAWVRALPPDGMRDGLEIAGDRALADAFFARFDAA